MKFDEIIVGKIYLLGAKSFTVFRNKKYISLYETYKTIRNFTSQFVFWTKNFLPEDTTSLYCPGKIVTVVEKCERPVKSIKIFLNFGDCPQGAIMWSRSIDVPLREINNNEQNRK